MSDLYLRIAMYKEMKFSCLNFHYAKAIPAGKYFSLSVFEDRHFVGCICFGYGACNNLHKSFNLKQTEVCELTRVALKQHENYVSKIISVAIKLLKKYNKGLKLIVSYADTEQKHTGAIYKAGNWLYLGTVSTPRHFIDIKTGKKIHPRSISAKHGTIKML